MGTFSREQGHLSEYRFGDIHTIGEVRLNGIVDYINSRPQDMLPQTAESLGRAYHSGNAMVVTREGSTDAVGFIKIEDLLNNSLKRKLGISELFPDIQEIGGGVILPTVQGQGLYGPLRYSLVESHADRIVENQVLILGTTKSPRVISTLDDTREGLGVEFQQVPHMKFPAVSAFTCVCSGNQGRGFQFAQNGDYSCFARIDPSELPVLPNRQTPKILCTMYVSSLPLAEQMNSNLFEQFGSLANIREQLIRVGYYN